MKYYPTQKEREEYNKREKICSICGASFLESYTKHTLSDFCSRKCACTFVSRLNRIERNKKIAKGLAKSEKRKVLKNKKLKEYEPVFCEVCGKKLSREQIQRKNKTCSLKCGSLRANKTKQQNGTVFIERGQGRSRSGYWKGFFCNSTYELVYYIYMTEHGYKVERNTKRYEYEWDGNKRQYYPDFLVNGKLVEVKGYWTEQVQTKIKAVTDLPIEVLYYKDLEHMMQYIDSKYNTSHHPKYNNYFELYDSSKPRYRYKYICDICGREFETNTYRKPGKWKHVVCSLECRTKSKKA